MMHTSEPGPDAHAGRPVHVQHHFESEQQQFDSDKLGMWLFLVTEILLFGGLFCAYAVYRANHPEIFIYAHKYLDKTLGGINTVVLILSSFTMAWAVRAAQLGQRRLLITLLALTLLGGVGFLSIKSIEYEHKWKHGLLWGTRFNPTMEEHGVTTVGEVNSSDTIAGKHAAAANGVAVGTAEAALALPATPATPADAPSTYIPRDAAGSLLVEHSALPPGAPAPDGLAYLPGQAPPPTGHVVEQPEKVHIFFGIYFAMTGLHAIHVIAGMVVILMVLIHAVRGTYKDGYYTPVDLTGLYWHLVDLIWIFLFPLLYLIH
jgi:cytochrome c oxidase subunit III